MKKKMKKLVLKRETLWPLGQVVGGVTAGPCGHTDPCAPPGEGGSDSYATCAFNTCGVCSGDCATGGACTT